MLAKLAQSLPVRFEILGHKHVLNAWGLMSFEAVLQRKCLVAQSSPLLADPKAPAAAAQPNPQRGQQLGNLKLTK